MWLPPCLIRKDEVSPVSPALCSNPPLSSAGETDPPENNIEPNKQTNTNLQQEKLTHLKAIIGLSLTCQTKVLRTDHYYHLLTVM